MDINTDSPSAIVEAMVDVAAHGIKQAAELVEAYAEANPDITADEIVTLLHKAASNVRLPPHDYE